MRATIRYGRVDPALLLDALVLPWSFLVLYGGDAGSGSLNTVSHITDPQTNGHAGTEVRGRILKTRGDDNGRARHRLDSGDIFERPFYPPCSLNRS